MAGYTTERSVWLLIANLSEGWKQGGLAHVAAEDVLLCGGRFRVEASAQKPTALSDPDEAFCAPERFVQEGSGSSEAAEVWTLGALAFYMLMGIHIFEHTGGKTQTAGTPVPRIGSAHCGDALSDLIRQCLAFEPARRPSMEQLHTAAQRVLQQEVKPSKRVVGRSGKAYGASLVTFWPEEMYALLLVVMLCFVPQWGRAQVQPNKELAKLVHCCQQLRQSDTAAQAQNELKEDTHWTLMDELEVDRNGECDARRVKTLGVNDLYYRLAKKQKNGVTNMGGHFCSGMDPRFNYSLIEVAVKKGCAVSYDITGREGEQQLAVVPADASARFTVVVTKGNEKDVATIDPQTGVTYVMLNKKVTKKDTFTLSIRNGSGKDTAFVLINYNARK